MSGGLDNIIDRLSGQELPGVEADFEQGIWSHVSAIEQKQLVRGRNAVAAGMLIAALGTGMVTGEQNAYANNSVNMLSGGSDYSPATLLHVTS